MIFREVHRLRRECSDTRSKVDLLEENKNIFFYHAIVQLSSCKSQKSFLPSEPLISWNEKTINHWKKITVDKTSSRNIEYDNEKKNCSACSSVIAVYIWSNNRLQHHRIINQLFDLMRKMMLNGKERKEMNQSTYSNSFPLFDRAHNDLKRNNSSANNSNRLTCFS